MDTNKHKQKLEEELVMIEEELRLQKPDMDTDAADESEVANKMEELEETSAVSSNLEIRHAEIKSALQKIEAGTYGKCEICNKDIELDRLEANPAAKTCKEHMNG